MKYFGRVYKLEVGNGSDTIVFDGMPSSNGKYPAQIEFLVTQSPVSYRSYCEITIYGVSRERRKAIYNQYDSVRLAAGYAEGFGVIFSGQIENVETNRNGPDLYVKLFCQSSSEEWPDNYVSKSFGNNTPYINIIREVASSFGKSVEFVGDFSDLPKAVNGMTLFKDSKYALNELARNFDFEWMMENDRIVIIKDGAHREDNDVFKFSPSSGLIGSPSITVIGVDIEVLLNPFIRPRDRFEVESSTGKLVFSSIYYDRLSRLSTGKGTHQVISLVHEGNFYGDVWKTKLEGVRPRVT